MTTMEENNFQVKNKPVTSMRKNFKLKINNTAKILTPLRDIMVHYRKIVVKV